MEKRGERSMDQENFFRSKMEKIQILGPPRIWGPVGSLTLPLLIDRGVQGAWPM
jgi:hypothetical protein